MKATVVIYKLKWWEGDGNGGGWTFCNTDIRNVGMQYASSWKLEGRHWIGAGPVPHEEFQEDPAYRWIAFEREDEATIDAEEAHRQGHDAHVIGYRDVYDEPWGYGSPAVTAAVRRVMMASNPELEEPRDGHRVISI